MSDVGESGKGGAGMAWSTLWRIAWRDVSRNRRRSVLSLLAVALGLALLITLNGFMSGVTADMLENSIRLESGHLQWRDADYEDGSLSLRPSELVDDLDSRLTTARAQAGIEAATPVLWMRGLLTGPEESVGVRLTGIEPDALAHAHIRDGLVAGDMLSANDREGVLLGQRLAHSLGLSSGDKLGLAIVDVEGQLDEGIFVVRGLFRSGVPAYDEATVFMALDKAQAFGRNRDRASAIVMLLQDPGRAADVAASLHSPGLTTFTWSQLNESSVQYMNMAQRFYWLLDAIVMLVVAVVIANTLLMAVFERIREMGILAALGMRSKQIRLLFLIEALLLGIGGSTLGIVLGSAAVAWLGRTGLDFGEDAVASAGEAFTLGSVLYPRFEPLQIMLLTLWTLAIIVLIALYPARFAANLEPVDALRNRQ